MSPREAILTGAHEADRLHDQLQSERKLSQTRGPIDVFGALLGQGITVMFRPLDGLLGACIPHPFPGVMISTKRPLPIQRFTGSHELGHVMMHHSTSLDGDEILTKLDDLDNSAEIQANAFAAAFLIPRWLLVIHAKAQGWNREAIKNPMVVYQMALRLGASYEATIIALKTHKLIDPATCTVLQSVRPKTLKQQLLPEYRPDHWYRDVWLLTEKDEGAVLEGQPDDLFLFRLNEKSGAGYLWDIEELVSHGFAIVADNRQLDATAERVGGEVLREVAARYDERGAGELRLDLRRPWQQSAMPLDSLHVKYDLRGKEIGFARAFRRQLEAA